MDDSTRELIAIGASIGAHCRPCLDYHVAKGRELGLTDEAIRAAIAVGHQVEHGAMSAMREYSNTVCPPETPR